jgi:hypothetical protein
VTSPEERAAAIAAIEESRETHTEWIEYIDRHPEEANRVAETRVEIAGSREHHERCVEKYDLVLRVLREEAGG